MKRTFCTALLFSSNLLALAQFSFTDPAFVAGLTRVSTGGGGGGGALDTNYMTLFVDGRDFDGLSNGDNIASVTDRSTNAWSYTINGGTIFRTNAAGMVGAQFSAGPYLTTSANMSRLINANEGTFVFRFIQFSGSAENTLCFLNAGGPVISVFATYDDALIFDYASIGAQGRSSVSQPVGWDDTPHTVVMRRKSDGTQTIRVDGVELSNVSRTDTTGSGTDTLYIGAYFGGLIPLGGVIRHAMLYRVWKSDSEVADIESWITAH